MNNMKPEIVYGDWIVIDGAYGVSVYPEEYMFEGEALADYLGPSDHISRVDKCEIQQGWAARLSMPGYLDCTEWVGPFDWKIDAQRYCDDMLRMEA